MRHLLFVLLLRLLPLGGLFAPCAAQALPTLAAPDQTVALGDTFSIPISALLIPGSDGLTSFQFDLRFDPAIIRATAVAEGPFLPSAGLTLFQPGVIDDATGLISLVTDSYLDINPPPSGDGVIVQVTFTALTPGVSPLRFESAFINDMQDIALIAGSVTVTGTAVSEPASVAVLTAALGLVLARRRKTPLPTEEASR